VDQRARKNSAKSPGWHQQNIFKKKNASQNILANILVSGEFHKNVVFMSFW
jgi:hypothetical protein